jgi:hypothetical protein
MRVNRSDIDLPCFKAAKLQEEKFKNFMKLFSQTEKPAEFVAS